MYQNRLARDSVKSFSPGVLVVCTLFSNLFYHLFFFFFLFVLMKNEPEKANPFLPRDATLQTRKWSLQKTSDSPSALHPRWSDPHFHPLGLMVTQPTLQFQIFPWFGDSHYSKHQLGSPVLLTAPSSLTVPHSPSTHSSWICQPSEHTSFMENIPFYGFNHHFRVANTSPQL